MSRMADAWKVLRTDGDLTLTKEDMGRHSPYGVYDGGDLVCLCLYRRGGEALMDYIRKLKGGPEK